jgi:hypothetical protein
MEVPHLGVSTIRSLDDHVSVIDEIKVSVLFHLRDNVEVFLDNKSVFFVHFTFDWITLPFINVDNVPLLMKSVVSAIDTNISILLVLITKLP